MARIIQGWERVGFHRFQGNVYLLSPASVVLEDQRAVLRREFAELGAFWRADEIGG
ncbi:MULTISPECIES: hypothetical protein [Streptomyces]